MENPGAKSCGTCKHFEPSSEWRRGWCRNTLLFAPSQSHLVFSEDLDCSRGAHSFWEPGTPRPQENAGQLNVKLPTFENPLKLFSPAFAGSANAASGMNGGHIMFASSGSGSGGGDDDYGYDDDYSFDDEPMQEAPAESRRPQSNRTRRSAGAANATGGRSRTAGVEPEGRFWTDYLRIALPVLGIILMLGLLWIWASSLLGGDDQDVDTTDDETIGLVQTETPDPNFVNTEPNTASTPGAQNTQTNAGEIPISGQTTPNPSATNAPVTTEEETPATGGDNQSGEDEGTTNGTDEEEAPADGEIAVDARVRITGELNVRPSAGTSGDPLWVSEVGEEGTVISGPEEADGYVWWELVFDGGERGFVIEEYLEVIP